VTSKCIKLLHRIEWRTKKGKLHRVGGPAVEFDNGSKEWWLNGKRHRIDGPAVEYTNGYKRWYLNGRCFSSPEEWLNSLTKDEQIAYLFNIGQIK